MSCTTGCYKSLAADMWPTMVARRCMILNQCELTQASQCTYLFRVAKDFSEDPHVGCKSTEEASRKQSRNKGKFILIIIAMLEKRREVETKCTLHFTTMPRNIQFQDWKFYLYYSARKCLSNLVTGLMLIAYLVTLSWVSFRHSGAIVLNMNA